MQSIWSAPSLLGDSRLLLPTAFLLIGVGLRQSHQWAGRWALGLATAGLVTLASKLAFLGWGVGVARLDFTGFSGHAVMSTAVWPVLLYVAMPPGAASRWAAFAGLMLAAGIAYSRLPLGAHSLSEVTSGWFLGALGSACAFHASREHRRLQPRWLALALGLGICVPMAFPQVHTHQMVVKLAKTLSGSMKEFDRATLHRR